MTMHKIHSTHWHLPDWHTIKSHLTHLVHDPRFWAALILGILVLLMLITSFVAAHRGMEGSGASGYPYHPYVPYLP